MFQKKTDYYKEFVDILDTLGRRYDLPRVFDDFLTMALCSYHQTNIATRLQTQDADNEALYMKTIKPYSGDEMNSFGKLLAIIQVNAAQNPYSDLLGEYYTEHITNGRNGQYFTPEAVCTLIAQMQILDEDNPPVQKRVYDPACGSGRLLLAFAQVAPNNYFFGNDVSLSCAKMTSLNFFLNGLRGEVAAMNTLSMEFYQAWQINTPTLGIKPIEKTQSQIWTAPPSMPKSPNVKLPSETQNAASDKPPPESPPQLTLF